MFKINNINPRKRCEMYSKLKLKTSERHSLSGVVITNIEHTSHLFLVNFKQVNVCWKRFTKILKLLRFLKK